MGKKGPRRGSLAFWHRARARRLAPRVRAWPSAGSGLQAFGGYKIGMTHVTLIDDKESPLKGQEIVAPVTLVETPPLFVYSIVFFERTPLGLRTLCEIPATNAPRELSRVHPIARKTKHIIEDWEKRLSEVADVRVTVCTQPRKSGLGKKTPEFFQIALGGKSVEEKLAAAKALLGREVPVSEVLREGQFVDVIAVTRGKGWQGVVKRFGVALNPRKATKARRHGGAIGAERQAKVMYSTPRPGQMGFHRRTDRRKRIMRVSRDASEFSRTKAFPHYGVPKTDFLVVEGSIPGPSKRFVLLRKTLRVFPEKKPDIKFVAKQAG